MTEAELQKAVIELAQLLGYRVFHARTSQNARGDYRTAVAGDGKGYVDLTLVGPRILFAELKAGGGRLRPEQIVWRDAILAAGGEWCLWTETDWMAGTVERVLRGEGK